MEKKRSFRFHTECRLVILTGRKARTLQELLEHLREVSGSCIFYHTHHQYLSQHFQKPVFYNEFAIWVERALQLGPLAEKLATVDLLILASIRQIREAIIAIIEEELKQNDRGTHRCSEGEEFHFCESKSFIMPTGLVANTVPEFFAKLASVTNTSLFFHFFEARLRLERPANDFSEWLKSYGQENLAAAIDRLNPYGMTLDELRDEIVHIGTKQGRT